jgi:hypothetical protein
MNAMDKRQIALKALEEYRIWGAWVVTLDLAAIGAIPFLFAKNEASETLKLPETALVAILCFALSILFATILLGNLPAVMLRISDSPPDRLEDVRRVNLLKCCWSPVTIASALEHFLFLVGAFLLVTQIFIDHFRPISGQ